MEEGRAEKNDFKYYLMSFNFISILFNFLTVFTTLGTCLGMVRRLEGARTPTDLELSLGVDVVGEITVDSHEVLSSR